MIRTVTMGGKMNKSDVKIQVVAILLIVLSLVLVPATQAQKIPVNNSPGINIPSPTVPKVPHPNAPKFEKIGPYVNYEYNEIRFTPVITNSGFYYETTAVELPEGAKYVKTGRFTNEKEFRWIPGANQAGKHEVKIKATNAYGESYLTVEVYVLNNTAAHVSLTYVYVKTERMGDHVRYRMMPMLVSDGERELETLDMQISTEEYHVINHNFGRIDWNDVHQVNDPEYGWSHAFVFDMPLQAHRESKTFNLSLSGQTVDGLDFSDEIEFEIGSGEVFQDFYRSNGSALVFRKKGFWADLTVYGRWGGYDGEIDGEEYLLHGDIVATGDFDGDQYDDFALIDEYSNVTFALSQLEFRGRQVLFQTLQILAEGRTLQVIGKGDFDGQGTDRLVVIDETNQLIEKWNLQSLRIGDRDSISIPENYEIMEVGDFDGDGICDLLWHDSNRNKLVIWSRGLDANYESVVMDWYGTERVLTFKNVNFNSGCDIVTMDIVNNKINVTWNYGPPHNRWNEARYGTWYFDWNEWEYIGIANVNGDRRNNILLRNFEDPTQFIFVASEGSAYEWKEVDIPLDEEWSFEHSADIDGDGRSELIWSKEYYNMDRQRKEKTYRIVYMEDDQYVSMTEFALTKEWELVTQ